jgi:transposase
LSFFDAQVQLLQTTPGLGPRTAEAVAAYLHDASRFKKGKESGGTRKTGAAAVQDETSGERT